MSVVEFVAAKLIEAGYDVKLQPFPVTISEILEGSELNATLMSYTTKFLLGPEFSVMRYSGSGEMVNVSLDFTNSEFEVAILLCCAVVMVTNKLNGGKETT